MRSHRSRARPSTRFATLAASASLGLALALSACAEAPPELVPCPIGQVYTGAGCLPLPRPFAPDSGVDPVEDAGLDDAALPEDAAVDAGLDPVDAGPEPTIELSGTWARRTRTSHLTGDADDVLGRLTVTILSRVELLQRGSSAEERITTCAIDVALAEGSVTTVTFPSAAVAALPSASTVATVDNAGFGTRFQPQRRILLFGFRTEQDPATDPLPQRADDPRVTDSDGDDQPGTTLIVGGTTPGELWTVGRMILFEQGIVRSATTIEGTAENAWTLVKLGASNDTLAALPVEVTADPQPTDELRMVRVATTPDGLDCGRLVAAQGELFP